MKQGATMFPSTEEQVIESGSINVSIHQFDVR